MMVSSVSAFASSEGSEYFWQAGAGHTYLIPELEYATIDQDVKAGGSRETTDTVLSVSAEYGYTEHMAFGATLGYRTAKTEQGATEDKEKGLLDVLLYMKGSHALSAGALKYGAVLGISPGKSKQESADEVNAYSGRHTLTPYVGYETVAFEHYKVGAKVSYEIALTDAKHEALNGTETEYSGADELEVSLFVERPYSKGNLGLALAHASISDTKDETNGGKTENSSITALEVYTDYTLNETTTLLGEVAYKMYGSTNVLDDGSGLSLLLGARFAL